MAKDFIGNELQVGDLVICGVSGNSSSATLKFGIIEKVWTAEPDRWQRIREKLTLATYRNYNGTWYRSTSTHDDFRKMCKVSYQQTLPFDLLEKYVEERNNLLDNHGT